VENFYHLFVFAIYYVEFKFYEHTSGTPICLEHIFVPTKKQQIEQQ